VCVCGGKYLLSRVSIFGPCNHVACCVKCHIYFAFSTSFVCKKKDIRSEASISRKLKYVFCCSLVRDKMSSFPANTVAERMNDLAEDVENHAKKNLIII